MKAIHIFRPGKHTAMSGATLSFSEADLRASAEAYDPKLHEAPLVVGHPKADAPAYGVVSSLAYGDDGLHAAPSDVDANFAELVRAKRYSKVSASFYLPDAPNNPKPGVYYLRHVGFLGAQPPAVKGLKPIEFGEAEDGVVEFGDWSDRQVASLFRRIREAWIGKFGLDDAEKVLPGYMVDGLAEDAAQPTEPPTQTLYAEGGDTMTPEQLAAQKADLDKREAELKAREASFAEQEQQRAAQALATRNAEIAEFAEDLIKAGQLRPADKARVVAVMQALPDSVKVLDFAEGATEATEQPIVTALKSFLKSLPKQIDFAERGKGDGTTKVDTTSHRALTEAARAHQATQKEKGLEVSFEEALQHVIDLQG